MSDESVWRNGNILDLDPFGSLIIQVNYDPEPVSISEMYRGFWSGEEEEIKPTRIIKKYQIIASRGETWTVLKRANSRRLLKKWAIAYLNRRAKEFKNRLELSQ